jgi:phospholipase/carboxylesterase
MASTLDLSLTHLYRPAAATAPQPWLLVLMHGVGSNEADLFGLAPSVPPQFHVLSLRAPNTMGGGSYAWFEFSVSANGERLIDEKQEAQSRAQVGQVVHAAAAQLGIASARVVVGGFSQGGIMSLSLLLTQPRLLHAALVWHGRLLPQALQQAAPAAALEGKALWVSHGLQDMVIPLANAHLIRERFDKLPVALTYREYPGVHEIRAQELQDSMDWLQDLAAA